MMTDIRIKVPGSGSISIPRLPVDAVMLEERAAQFKRSIKRESKLAALLCAIGMIDLTTLEGADTPLQVEQLCDKAKQPFSQRLVECCRQHPFFKDIKEFPQPAAICVYSDMVPVVVECLKGTKIHTASVATSFPAGRVPFDIRMKDVAYAIKHGADEIDMVIDRGAFLSGKYQKVFDQIVKVKDACGDIHLKVILETGELFTYDKIRLASWLAMEAGADFIKTSTGKISSVASMPITLTMLQAIADYYDQTGKRIGMKPAGGFKRAKQAIHYLCMVNEELGTEWLTPRLFRFGASGLINDILRQIYFVVTGTYADYESLGIGWK